RQVHQRLCGTRGRTCSGSCITNRQVLSEEEHVSRNGRVLFSISKTFFRPSFCFTNDRSARGPRFRLSTQLIAAPTTYLVLHKTSTICASEFSTRYSQPSIRIPKILKVFST